MEKEVLREREELKEEVANAVDTPSPLLPRCRCCGLLLADDGLGSAECSCPEVVKSCCQIARSEVTDCHVVHWLARGVREGRCGQPSVAIYYCSLCRDYLCKPHHKNLLSKGVLPSGLNPGMIAAHMRDKDGDHSKAVAEYRRRKHLPDPAFMMLFYQYVRPKWTEEERERIRTWFVETCRELRICGRVKLACEGVNCCLSGLTADAHEFEQRLKSGEHNPLADLFRDTLVKYSAAPESALFPKLKVFLADEVVGFGIDVSDFEPVPKLTPQEWHQKMEEPGIVMVDVRNYYESRIGRFIAPGGRFVAEVSNEACPPTETIDPLTRYFSEFPDWVHANKASLEGKTVLVY